MVLDAFLSSHAVAINIMIAHYFDSNAIIVAPFKSCANKHRLFAYNAIMQSLKDCNILVELQILDNEAIAEYNCIINSEWGV